MIFSRLIIDKCKLVAFKIRVKCFMQRALSRLLNFKSPHPHLLVFIAGLPKSGTTWLENLVTAIPGYCRLVCYDINNDLSSDPKHVFIGMTNDMSIKLKINQVVK